MIKKLILGAILLLIITLSIGGIYLYRINQSVNHVLEKEKRSIKPKEIPFSVETISIETENPIFHLTHLNDTTALLPDPFTIITTGGFIQGESVNRSLNALHLKNPIIQDKKLLMGYRDGFVLLEQNSINHFIFGKQFIKCIAPDQLYCLTIDREIIESDPAQLKTFTKLYQSKDKIVDIAFYLQELYLLKKKTLEIYRKEKIQKIPLPEENQISKIINLDHKLLLISDRQVYQLNSEKITPLISLPGVTDIVHLNNHTYYATLQGAIFREKDQITRIKYPIHKLQIINNTIYLLTTNGLYMMNERGEISLKEHKIPQLSQNMVSALSLKDNLLDIGYFNQGIDQLQITNQTLSKKRTDLHGINEIYPKNDTTYIATTNGFYQVNQNQKFYSRKDGLLGRNVSKILQVGSDLYIATEGGLSLKNSERFESIYGWHGLVSNRINTLAYSASKNILYVGTLGGLSLVRGLRVLKNISKLKTPWITALTHLNNKLYIGSYGSGITIFENDKLKQVTSGRIFINPNAVAQCGDNILWGTLKKGILIYHLKSKKYHFYDEGSSANITALSCSHNTIFVGSDFGLWQLNKDMVQ